MKELFYKKIDKEYFQLLVVDKDEMKAAIEAGAFIAHGQIVSNKVEGFERWLPAPMEYPHLYVDLIPKTSFFTNLRSELSQAQWDYIRKIVYKRAGYKCEICGGQGEKWPVEAHERWSYKDGVQSLVGVQALCPSCHQATHIGLAEVNGKRDEAILQLMTVNGWSRERTEKHVNDAFSKWAERSKESWKLDISRLKVLFPGMPDK